MKEQSPKTTAAHHPPKSRLADIFAAYQGKNGAQKGAMIPILQKVQEKEGFLSEDAINEIANFLKVSANEVYGVATFYAQFRFSHPGDHTVKVCLGTACHVRGAGQVLETVERELHCKQGEVTTDHKFGLERVACFGCCALAPVMVVDKKVYSKMSTTKVKDVLAEYK